MLQNRLSPTIDSLKYDKILKSLINGLWKTMGLFVGQDMKNGESVGGDKKEEAEEPTKFDHILENVVGGAGRYQWSLLAATSAGRIVANSAPLIHVLTAYTPPHR